MLEVLFHIFSLIIGNVKQTRQLGILVNLGMLELSYRFLTQYDDS